MTTPTRFRTAIVYGPERIVAAYLPNNYHVATAFIDQTTGRDVTVIQGLDHAGWTLDAYVIPRLASGLYAAKEIEL